MEIGGNERYVSVSRQEFKEVFYAGKQIRLIDPLEQRGQTDQDQQDDLLE